VALQRKLDEKKVKTCQFGSAEWFWRSICAKAGKWHNKAYHLQLIGYIV
jgi:hypothetical protein